MQRRVVGNAQNGLQHGTWRSSCIIRGDEDRSIIASRVKRSSQEMRVAWRLCESWKGDVYSAKWKSLGEFGGGDNMITSLIISPYHTALPDISLIELSLALHTVEGSVKYVSILRRCTT